jgi:hypothetical protein
MGEALKVSALAAPCAAFLVAIAIWMLLVY